MEEQKDSVQGSDKGDWFALQCMCNVVLIKRSNYGFKDRQPSQGGK